MDLTVGLGTAAAIGAGAYAIRRYRGANVNCWFCSTSQRVPWKLANCFVCCSCSQYNGFTADGDYNKRIPAQYMPSARDLPRRYCFTSRKTQDEPSFSENPLCDDCNAQQAKIITRLNQFEPENEDRWQAEYDDYKERLNRVYPLCERCCLATQRRLASDKVKYGYLLQIKKYGAALFKSAKSVIAQSTPIKASQNGRKRGRLFFAGGAVTVYCHLINFALATIIWMADFNALAQAADFLSLKSAVPFALSVIVFPLLHFLQIFALPLIGLTCLLHSTAMWKNRCRVSFPDLLFFADCFCIALCHLNVPAVYTNDVVVLRCGFVSIFALLSAAVLFLPRKLLRTKRPNTISSAFSIASTPASQATTIRSTRSSPISPLHRSALAKSTLNTSRDTEPRMTEVFARFAAAADQLHTTSQKQPSRSISDSFVEKNKENCSPLRSIQNRASSSGSTTSSATRMQWRERRELTPLLASAAVRQDEMDWEASEASFAGSQTSVRHRMTTANRQQREATPARELGGLLRGMKLGATDNSEHRGGPFGSRAPSVFAQHHSPTYAQSMAGYTSVSQLGLNPHLVPRSLRGANSITNDDSVSVCTHRSISSSSSVWWSRFIVFGFVVCFLFNAFLAYHILLKQTT